MNTPVMPIDQARIEAVLDEAAAGKPMAVQAKVYGQAPRTLWKHLCMDAVFKQAWSQARECSYFLVADSVPYIHEEFPEASAHERQQIFTARTWWLSKMYPAVFGDKIQVQIEHVDLKGALTEARTRVITIVNSTPNHSDAPE